jgi:oxygen-dependent protoporphyrinogen oxidase
LPQAIADNLPSASLKLEARISLIEANANGWSITWIDQEGREQRKDYRNIVITTPPHKLSDLPLPEELHQELQPIFKIESPPVTSLTLGFKREDVAHPLDGFGMLIKQSEKSPLLGVLFSSSMFDGRAPDGHVTLTCMMGGSINPHYADNDDQVVLDELRKLLGVTGEPTFRHQTSWPHAIPQYSLDYQDKLDTLDACEQSHPGLHLAGNYRNGISVIDCMLNGLELGQRLS